MLGVVLGGVVAIFTVSATGAPSKELRRSCALHAPTNRNHGYDIATKGHTLMAYVTPNSHALQLNPAWLRLTKTVPASIVPNMRPKKPILAKVTADNFLSPMQKVYHKADETEWSRGCIMYTVIR